MLPVAELGAARFNWERPKERQMNGVDNRVPGLGV